MKKIGLLTCATLLVAAAQVFAAPDAPAGDKKSARRTQAQGGKTSARNAGRGNASLRGRTAGKTMTLQEARAHISEAAKNPDVLTQVMKQLASAADQKQFVAEVNAALSEMPGSVEARTAAILNADKALIRGAAQGNLIPVVTEVFATAPIESLTVLNERFASDLFNRSADPTTTYTDEEYVETCKKVMTTVNERMETVENGPARSTFVILMLNRATNGSVPQLTETLVETLPTEVQNVAKSDWIPAAMGESEKVEGKDYGPLLGEQGLKDSVPDTEKKASESTTTTTEKKKSTDEEKTTGTEKTETEKSTDTEKTTDTEKSTETTETTKSTETTTTAPDVQVVMRFAGPQVLESMLGDVVEGTPLVNTETATENNTDPIIISDNDQPHVDPAPDQEEPGGYQNQSL